MDDPLAQEEELTLEEYEKIFQTVGHPYWVTLTGGEPFLRKDFGDIAVALCSIVRPAYLTITSNGLLHQHIYDEVLKILKRLRNCRLILNLSLDHLYDAHDFIRGVKGNFRCLCETIERLKHIRNANFTLGINTVISTYNADKMCGIIDYVTNKIEPDSFIVNPVLVGGEYMSSDNSGFLEKTKIAEIMNCLLAYINKSNHNKKTILTRAFRRMYYTRIKHYIKNSGMGQTCYAGYNSCFINPYGMIESCVMKRHSFGNLRESNYNFRHLWQGQSAQRLRKDLWRHPCSCSSVNVFYTNTIMNMMSLIEVLNNYMVMK